MNNKNILITGIAGFIGYSLAKSLLNTGVNIIGIDNINNYYDVNLKLARLNNLGFSKKDITPNNIVRSNIDPNLTFQRLSLEDNLGIEKIRMV